MMWHPLIGTQHGSHLQSILHRAPPCMQMRHRLLSRTLWHHGFCSQLKGTAQTELAVQLLSAAGGQVFMPQARSIYKDGVTIRLLQAKCQSCPLICGIERTHHALVQLQPTGQHLDEATGRDGRALMQHALSRLNICFFLRLAHLVSAVQRCSSVKQMLPRFHC